MKHLIAALLFSIGVLGCDECTTSTDCESGSSCVLGECRSNAGCEVDDDCGGEQRCIGGECRSTTSDDASVVDTGSADGGTSRPDASQDAGFVDSGPARIWPRFETGTWNTLHGVWGADDNDVWAVGEAGTILHFNGTSWQPAAVGTSTATLFDIAGTGATNVWAVGGQGTILHYDGSQWSPVSSSTTGAYFAVAPVDDDDVWLFGSAGVGVHWNGSGFTSHSLGVDTIILDARVDDDSSVWAVGTGGQILRYDGAWHAFDPLIPVKTPAISIIASRSRDDTWFAGKMTEIYRWNGSDFEAELGSIFLQQADLLLTPNSSMVIAAAGQVVERFNDGTMTFMRRPGTNLALDAHRLPSGTIWVVGGAGLAFRGPDATGLETDPPHPDGGVYDGGTPTFESMPRVSSLALSTGFTCVGLSDGHVICWGGAFGSAPQTVNGFTEVVDVAVSQGMVCGRRAGRNVLCKVVGSPDPIFEITGTKNVRALFSSEDYVCASFHPTGVVACWNSSERAILDAIPHITNAAGFVSTGSPFDSCTRISDGTVRCRGDNSEGQLGDGSRTQSFLSGPVIGLAEVVSIGMGYHHACAVHSDGLASCWGSNSGGVIGDGTTEERPLPVRVAGIGNAASIGSGWDFNCARMKDGTVSCWGSNNDGQLGNGTGRHSNVPMPVPNLTNVVELVTSRQHTCVLNTDREVWCWGSGFGVLPNRVTELP